MIQLDGEDSERNELQLQQFGILCPADEVSMKIMGRGISNQLSKPE
jgi:hypothetical protein